jgi:hypothetical protein
MEVISTCTMRKNQNIKGKKGIFFTFAAIALAVILLLSYKTYNESRLAEDMGVIEIRITTLNDFIKDLEDDISNAIFISAFRSLLSLEDYMMKYDQFFNELGAPSLNTAFSDAFQKGTIDSPSGPSDIMILMENNTFINWTTRMKEHSNKTDISVDFTINSVTISQSEPWFVDVTVNLDIDVKDNKKTASWAINDKDYTKKINISSFIDPLYIVNNNGLVNNTITKTTVPNFNDEDDLNTHLINSYYIEHSDAPNYLMRFENNLNGNSNGIESLVNSQNRIDEGLSALSRSAVDYIYFETGIEADCEVKKPSYSWFRLDTATHIDYYDAQCKGGS